MPRSGRLVSQRLLVDGKIMGMAQAPDMVEKALARLQAWRVASAEQDAIHRRERLRRKRNQNSGTRPSSTASITNSGSP